MWITYLPSNGKHNGEALLESKTHPFLIHLARLLKALFPEKLLEISRIGCAKFARVSVMQSCLLIKVDLQEAHARWCP